VLRDARRVADAEGFEAVTVRRLGRELGVHFTSLYNHVADKDDIRNGIVDLVLNEVEIPEDGGDWKTALRRSAISAHDAFLRHRWACNLMLTTTEESPARLRWMEFVLRTLREAGFSPDLTDHGYHALDSHITGFTLWEVSFPFTTREELTDLATGFLRDLPADEFPYVTEHVHQHLAEPDPDGTTEFAFGLDLILDGLERILGTTR
jgi:AcrR family transcriptional regulator